MSLSVIPAGAIPVTTAGVTTPVSITASTALTVPTGTQMPSGAGGPLCVVITIERADATATASRWTTNGVTPTTTVGSLRPGASNAAPDIFVLRGKEYISAFRIIGAGAGNVMTYQFYIENDRG